MELLQHNRKPRQLEMKSQRQQIKLPLLVLKYLVLPQLVLKPLVPLELKFRLQRQVLPVQEVKFLQQAQLETK